MGHDVVHNYRAARSALGIVPQELVFDPFFTVRETLRFQSGYFGIRNNDDWIDEILANIGLSDKAETNMRKLSGGMKRRAVMVARAVGTSPRRFVPRKRFIWDKTGPVTQNFDAATECIVEQVSKLTRF